MKNDNGYTYQTISVKLLLFVMVMVFIFTGCSNSKLIAKKKQFERMPDKELLSYYYLINDRLDDIDRDTERRKVKENKNYHPDRDRIQHLHIGDTWYQLRQEKKLVLDELQTRNLAPHLR